MFTRTPLFTSSRATRPRGLTIVEMLVSLACVIILMLAYTQLFSDVGGRISDARSMIELETRMRSAANRLRADLAAITCDVMPWQKPEAGPGFFEYIEGPLSDRPGFNGYSSSPAFLGDTDDVIMWTMRSKEGPFTGNVVLKDPANPNSFKIVTATSEQAEVVWFLRPTLQRNPASPSSTVVFQPSASDPRPPMFTLYRRVLLVLPNNTDGTPVRIPYSTPANVTKPDGSTIQSNKLLGYVDHSLHLETQGGSQYLVGNTLGDLTKRECRFAHDGSAFPHRVNPLAILPFGWTTNTANGVTRIQLDPSSSNSAFFDRYGEDVVLTNVVAFDVQAWDPSAPVQVPSTSAIAVAPGDSGYQAAGTAVSTGAFVDLGWGNTAYSSSPSTPMRTLGNFDLNSASTLPAKNHLVAGAKNASLTYDQTWLFHGATDSQYVQPATYDTWSTHYEHDGIDQDGVSGADQGADGFQDDVGKYETSPPYPVPLRGVKIIIRCYEPDSRQFHEVSVVESFVPE